MKNLKMLAVAVGVVAIVGSALAIPTQTVVVYDAGALDDVFAVVSGTVTYTASDAWWTVTVTGTSYPPAIPGNFAAPVMDLSITATDNGAVGGAAHTLIICFGAAGFGPTSGSIGSTLTGQVSGTGSAVTYTTYYNAANLLPVLHPGEFPPGSIALSTIVLPGPGPNYSGGGGGTINQAAPYSFEQVVTIADPGAATYSLDASLSTVPDGGTTVMLLGAALSGVALLRRMIS